MAADLPNSYLNYPFYPEHPHARGEHVAALHQ